MAKVYSHLFYDKYTSQPFKSPKSGGSQNTLPERERDQHFQFLMSQWRVALTKNNNTSEILRQYGIEPDKGVYVGFEGAPGFDLNAQGLENRKYQIRLMRVNSSYRDDNEIIQTTIYYPSGTTKRFEDNLNDYQSKQWKNGSPKHNSLICGIERISQGQVEDLWADDKDEFPGDDALWCEVWIKCIDDADATQRRFQSITRKLQIETRDSKLVFPELLVLLAKATGEQLRLLFGAFPYLSEIKRVREPASFFLNMKNADQSTFIHEFNNRLDVNVNPKVAVCVLDTGVNQGIKPLNRVIHDNACVAYCNKWKTSDQNGHGTAMCSMVAFGDLIEPLNRLTEPDFNGTFRVEYAVESAKILPDYGLNRPELYGDIINRCIAIEELQADYLKRVVCMAITTTSVKDGRPTSFSAAVDSLTFNEDDYKRLMLISAGNIDDDEKLLNYPIANKSEMIQDPGQSWNALTVGAYTGKVSIKDKDFVNYEPIAPKGGLSPRSTTSTQWKKWPIKPDIVMEGGNYAYSPDKKQVDNIEDLTLLALDHKFGNTFTTHADTSAATALAARLAGQIYAKYPDAWPETIRGLMVHSARWNDEMLRICDNNKKECIRVFGYGVPELHRAIDCAENSLTLIAQSKIQPYTLGNKSKGKLNEMNFHQLPWPKETLLKLGNVNVELRITLSYFIEPAPGMYCNNNYRYASYGLRFALNNPYESQEDFCKRINALARNDDKAPSSYRDNHTWMLGTRTRDLGSVISDVCSMTAADLAACNMICISPIGGWWKDRPTLGKVNRKVRYSLIVSLHTEEQSVDIYTPVKMQIDNQVKIPITIEYNH